MRDMDFVFYKWVVKVQIWKAICALVKGIQSRCFLLKVNQNRKTEKCEKQRERERERSVIESQTKKERQKRVCVCVCVCEQKRKGKEVCGIDTEAIVVVVGKNAWLLSLWTFQIFWPIYHLVYFSCSFAFTG